MNAYSEELNLRASQIDEALARLTTRWDGEHPLSLAGQIDAMKYSLVAGGKRVRPVLSLWTAECFGSSVEDVFPWALAIEMIHTYSLIHDDLPCMDDDDERRGRPTNHVVFGEANALLAGDALLTEAFHFLAVEYAQRPETCVKLVRLLGRAAGMGGMVGGQFIDLNTEESPTLAMLEDMHRRKTGALISAAVEGAALLGGASDTQLQAIREFGDNLGLAFQIADDILDAGNPNDEGRSFVSVLGLETCTAELRRVTDVARAGLKRLDRSPSPWLEKTLDWNLERRL